MSATDDLEDFPAEGHLAGPAGFAPTGTKKKGMDSNSRGVGSLPTRTLGLAHLAKATPLRGECIRRPTEIQWPRCTMSFTMTIRPKRF